MPGVLPHLFVGIILSFVGKYSFKDYFKKNPNDILILVVVCLLFSMLPDIFLGIYYITHVLSFETLKEFHNLMHFVFSPIAVISLVIPIFWKGLSKRPIWIMGLIAIGIHILMDLLIEEYGVLI
jgi:Na+/melibiose symporter-like transporter